MAEHSKIEWTDSTWTPIRARNRETGRIGHFCIHKSPGCKHCYSEIMQRRFGNPIRFAAQDAGKVEMFLDEAMLTKPLGWKKPRMVFVCSMTDLFLEGVPDEWIDRVFAVMALAPRHVFHQQRAAERIPHLLDTPAAVRFLSAEPLLGPIDLTRLELVPDSLDEDGDLRRAGIRVDALRNKHCESGVTRGLGAIDWCIVGGESGPKARPMHPQWARDLRDQCSAAGVSFFFKQWGEWTPYRAVGGTGWSTAQNVYRDGRPKGPWQGYIHDGTGDPEGYMFGRAFESKMSDDWKDILMRLGKKRAGRLLDGREWNEVPA